MQTRFFGFLSVMLLLACGFAATVAQDEKIDWTRAKELHQRAQQGEKLNAEDQAYYEKAKAALAAGKGPGEEGRGAPVTVDTSKLIPLTELGEEKYKGEIGGLYGNGMNEPPEAHLASAIKATMRITPLGNEGKPDKNGKVVLLSIGMSNTTQEFSRFVELAKSEPKKSPSLVIVDGAQGGQAAIQWADPKADARRPGGGTPWDVAEQRMKSAGVTPEQVQVVWIKQALIQQGQYGEHPKHTDRFAQELVKIVGLAKEKYPNLRVAYLSSRIYAGYAKTQLNPEPYAYEGAFAVRKVIAAQIAGDKELDYKDAPILLWGPYLWANGEKPRKSDGLVYASGDLSGDGTHPSRSGQQKVAKLLLDFFTKDELAKTWFMADAK
ncbi:MAG: hypothetical protein ACR2FY_21705 [Pirellulaceae bacterium]